MFANGIRELSLEEIEQKIQEAYQELFNLRFQLSSKQLKDYNRVKVVKRDIALLKTVARQKAQG